MSSTTHKMVNTNSTKLVAIFTVLCIVAVIAAYGISVLDLKWSIFVFLGRRGYLEQA